MRLRNYLPTDAPATLDVFLRAIRQTASQDYTPEQIAVWARDDIDLDEWNVRRAAATTLVAVVDDRVVGFTDLDGTGYIDMMFVDPGYARRGIATTLLERIVATANERGLAELTTHASLTARPFFERHSFVVLEQRHPVRRGVELTNFTMRRTLAP